MLAGGTEDKGARSACGCPDTCAMLVTSLFAATIGVRIMGQADKGAPRRIGPIFRTLPRWLCACWIAGGCETDVCDLRFGKERHGYDIMQQVRATRETR